MVKKSLNVKKLRQAKKLQKENFEEEEDTDHCRIDGFWYQYLVHEASDLVEKTY